MAALSENAVKIMDFLKTSTEDVTVHEVSAAIELPVNSVTGTFNSFVKKGLGERVAAEITNEDGTHKAVKLLKLTEAGMAFDPTAPVE